MITDIVKMINSMDLGIYATFGFKDTKDNGIYVMDTLNRRTSQHSVGERLEILICITDVNDGYIKCRDLADKIYDRLLQDDNVHDVTTHYIGEYENKQQYSINLSCGGI